MLLESSIHIFLLKYYVGGDGVRFALQCSSQYFSANNGHVFAYTACANLTSHYLTMSMVEQLGHSTHKWTGTHVHEKNTKLSLTIEAPIPVMTRIMFSVPFSNASCKTDFSSCQHRKDKQIGERSFNALYTEFQSHDINGKVTM